MSKATDGFLKNEALTLTMTGALAVRGGTPVYRKGTSDSDREEVRNHIKGLLRSITRTYEAAVSEEDHIKAIVNVPSDRAGLGARGRQRAEERRSVPPWRTEHAIGRSTPRFDGTFTSD